LIFAQFDTIRFGHGSTDLRCPGIHVNETTVSSVEHNSIAISKQQRQVAELY
jgi:hypothetical protein